MLKCARCEKLFKYESERKRHQESHIPQFDCKACAKKFSFLSALRRHQKQHERKGSVRCDDCGGNFRDNTLLKRHKQYAHEGSYSCIECSATFSSEQALRTHRKIHKPESERQFRCTYNGCKKTFNFPHHLKHHELTHTNTKQHFCNICQKGFIQFHHLKTHLNTHHPENWLPCVDPRCKKKFINKNAWKKHVSTHSKCIEVNSSTEIKLNIGSSPFSNPANDIHQRGKANDDVPCVICGKFILRIQYLNHTLNCSERPKAPNTCDDLQDVSLNHDLNLENRDSAISTDQVTSGTYKLDTRVESKDKCKAGCTYRCDIPEHMDRVGTGAQSNLSVDGSAPATACSGCASASRELNNTSLEPKQLSTRKNNNLPEFEERKDGVIKIRETFDSDIVVLKKEIPQNVKVLEKIDNDLKYVPFNSCKAVLGNCIVSEDGSVDESCLCAKMLVDEQQMSAQEIDELTPNPSVFW